MRSHAKASTAGSNSGQASRIFAFACLALGVLLCLTASSAFAEKTHLYTGVSFGPEGAAGSASFANVQSVAVDQAGSVYVYDTGEAKIYKFDSAGEPLNFSSTGTNSIEGVFGAGDRENEIAVAPPGAPGGTAGDIYVAGYPNVRVYAASGESLGTLTSAGACGVATDPAGHLFVSVFVTSIDEYTPTANPPTGADLSASSSASFPGACNIAVDGLANFYAAQYSGEVISKLEGLGDETPTPIEPGAYSLATDPSTNDLYVNRGSELAQYSSAGALIATFGSGQLSESRGVAVNGSSGDVYVSSGSGKVHIFGPAVPLPDPTTGNADGISDTEATLHGSVNSNGAQLTDCHFEFVPASQFNTDQYESITPAEQVPCVPNAASIPADSADHAVKADLSGLDPTTTYHFRLVVANAEVGARQGSDHSFRTTGLPLIGASSVESVGTAEATLATTINPNGAPTTYHVEYGATTSYGQSSAESLPIGFEGDNSAHTVSVHIGGLQPGTAYHFRFVATNLVGSSEGADGTFATFPTPPSFGPCPNDQFRGGLGARLPDCRAYEQATPVDKHGANIQGFVNAIQASSAGDRVSFYLAGGLTASQGSSTLSAFIASRSPSGWSSAGLLPATSPGFAASVTGWSEDLTTTVVEAPGPGDVGKAISLRDSDSGAFQLGLTTTYGFKRFVALLAGFAADTAHLIFESEADFLPGAVAGKANLYDLDHGTLTLAGRIPAGAATSCDDASGPACVAAPEGSFAGPYAWASSVEAGDPTSGGATRGYYTQNTISRDGSRIFFTTANSAQLYVREDGTKTTRISASQRTAPDPNGEKPAAFMAATPDGSKVFFTSCEKLTDDSTAVSTGENSCTTAIFGKDPSQGQDLYSYDTDSGELTDLTVDTNAGDPRGAAVKGVLGASDDGSYVYFTAAGVLAPGASPGNCDRETGAEAPCNLYVSHDGVTTFVAPLGRGSDSLDWVPNKGQPKTSRVSADGSTLLFSSYQSLTGYDNTTPLSSTSVTGICAGHICPELFRYDAPDEELTCVSCNPAGTPPGPDGGAALGTADNSRNFLHEEPNATFLTRNLSANGSRVFFDSRDALVASDTNGVNDVYEWEAKGSGSCESESQNGGCLYLISSGTSPDPSYFGDASVNGDRAFIFTSQQLVPSDHDELVDVYDAGSGDGLASQHALAPPTCASTACQSNPPPPVDPALSSASFTGPGNAHKPPAARKCPKGKRKVRRAGKVSCKKQSKHKQHKRHTNRGGSK